jgi:hypothetical protein
MLGRFRITNPTLAIVANDGHHDAITIPSGAIVDLDGKKFNGERLMQVLCDDRMVLMFTEDLKGNSVPLWEGEFDGW